MRDQAWFQKPPSIIRSLWRERNDSTGKGASWRTSGTWILSLVLHPQRSSENDFPLITGNMFSEGAVLFVCRRWLACFLLFVFFFGTRINTDCLQVRGKKQTKHSMFFPQTLLFIVFRQCPLLTTTHTRGKHAKLEKQYSLLNHMLSRQRRLTS